jgi:hypothetical protein
MDLETTVKTLLERCEKLMDENKRQQETIYKLMPLIPETKAVSSKEYLEEKFKLDAHISNYYTRRQGYPPGIELGRTWSDEDIKHLISYFNLKCIDHALNAALDYTLMNKIKTNFLYQSYYSAGKTYELFLDKETIINKWIPLFNPQIHEYLLQIYK